MAYVSRDPFAREELHRSFVRNAKCSWCGSARITRTGNTGAYTYRIETDGGRTHDIRGTFCSTDCMHTYHG